MLFTITQAELKYKELDNYHYVVTKYSKDRILEKEECWFKSGISKTNNLIYQDKEIIEKLTCINYNTNEGYKVDDNSNKTLIDVEEYKMLKGNIEGNEQFYSKLPVKIKTMSFWNILITAIYDFSLDVNIGESNIFFTCENIFINIEKETMKPIACYYKDNKSDEFITIYFNIELNCIDELKI